ncbi:putative bifunctional diguanylate cyclase/phosphodiesterase [Leucothrix arctica]|uniref:PAS domain S-box protein n=1 Tax=Leucothrix arctica TaxID=1481894 RepID=A0A317CRF4_9GAMM|nr:EAL domain-containing protein [Leucothrix arctica]PWQ99010.1 PAS domain S-box protein [Leucothrix arctica]
MKVSNVPVGQSNTIPVMTLVLLVTLSLMLAGLQLFNVADLAGIQVYLPMIQTVLLLIAVTLGVVFYKIKTQSLESQDVLGLTHGASQLSFKNTEAVLGATVGGVIRVNRQYEAEYLSEAACTLTGWNVDDATGLSIESVVSLQGLRAEGSLRQIIADQFLNAESVFDLHDVKMLTKNSDSKYVRLKTVPVQSGSGEIDYVALVIQDVTDDRAAMEDLYQQASRDSMTGLLNRKSFQENLKEVLASGQETKAVNVLCYLDLDHFKTVNDVCGHAAGDELLKQVADLFSRRVRSTDKLARTGGDEFAILLVGCGIQRAQKVLERILQDVQAYRFTWNQNTFQVGVSIGVIEFDSSSRVTDMGRLMLQADEACYMAKKLGRNQLYIQDDKEVSSEAEKEKSTDWEGILNSALKHDGFSLYVQPIVPLQGVDGSEDCQYEVLIRMPHEGEVLSPGSFMPAAQRLGLMGSVDRWVVEKAVKNIASGNFTSNKKQIFTINLSADSVSDDSFTDYLQAVLTDNTVPASMLCFEVSESVVLANFMKAQVLFNDLVEIGASGSLDDFGSGISSLSYLRDLPVSYLKIDGAFIRSMSKNRIDAAMVDAVNKVGQVMNLKTIAESVEDDITKQLLKRMGVDYAQGYHCGKPLAFENIYLSEAS